MSFENYIAIIEHHTGGYDKLQPHTLNQIADKLTVASKGGTATVQLKDDTVEATIRHQNGLTYLLAVSHRGTFVTINHSKYNLR